MNTDDPIFVRADQPVGAQLRYPGHVIKCGSIREAVSAWRRLAEEDKLRATIRDDNGNAYGPTDIPRLFNN